MKKIIALTLTLVFVLAALTSLTMTASAAELDLYTPAKDGDVVFTANFCGIPGEWEPAVFMGTPVITPSADGTEMTIGTSTDKSKNYWGAEITSLPLNEETRYTIYYTITRTNVDAVGVYCDTVYGAYGYAVRNKLMNQGSSLAGHDYVYYANVGIDAPTAADGETLTQDFALEINGTNYAVTLYIKNNAGEYVVVDDSGFDGIPFFNSDYMGLYFYIYYAAHTATISNCYIVKGLSFGEYEVPETTPAPETTAAPETEAPVTEAPETEAPETEAPATEAPVETTVAPTTTAPTTEAPKAEGGCGGFVALGVIAALIPAAVVVLKKRD